MLLHARLTIGLGFARHVVVQSLRRFDLTYSFASADRAAAPAANATRMGSNVAIRGFDTRPIAAPIARSPAGVAKKLLLQREPLQLCLRSLCPLLHQQDQHAEGQLRAFYSQRIYLFSSRQKRKGR